MKNRIFSIVLALVLPLALAVPALAAEEPEPTPEPEYRLISVAETMANGGQLYYTFTYGQGGYLPTEVICANDTSCPVTVTYDEAGRIAAYQDSYDSKTFVYDEAGNCVRDEYTHTNTYGDGGAYTTVTENEFDENGNCVRSEETSTGDIGSEYTAITESAYDESGNCMRSEHTVTYSDGGVSTSVTEYTYDGAGNCVREELTRTDSDGAVSTSVTEYAYDEEGRALSKVTTDGGGEISTSTYDYSEDGRSVTTTSDNGNISVEYEVPLLDARWDCADYIDLSVHIGTIRLWDSTNNTTILYVWLDSESEPTLTYDDNGYLVRVDGTAGDYIEFTYEPVA